jgi:proteic killer suppression protein
VEIEFEKSKLRDVFNNESSLISSYGKENGRTIMRRMSVLRAAQNLEQVSYKKPERRHQLRGKRKGEFAVDLTHPFRLVFRPNHDPVPLKEDGGIDLKHVTSIIIIRVEDYH